MLSMVFADISRKIRHTIGFISHTNIPHIFCINTPPKPNDHYLKRRCMKKKKQAESERGDFH